MTGRTDSVTKASRSEIILVWYCLTDDAYMELEGRFKEHRTRLRTLGLKPETVAIDAGLTCVRLRPSSTPGKRTCAAAK